MTLAAAGLGALDKAPTRNKTLLEWVRKVAALGPRAIAYVACDPAALARDLATFRETVYALAGLRCFDAFPMTHHVETVALLAPASGWTSD